MKLKVVRFIFVLAWTLSLITLVGQKYMSAVHASYGRMQQVVNAWR